MAPDERDRIFDQALARHLRSAAPAGEAAGLPGISSSQSGACPDSETLAAYHERSLLPEQLNSLKEHIVGCANCQAILAHLETTDEIPLQTADQEQVLTQSVVTPIASASGQTQATSPAAIPTKSRRVRLLRGARWQWLAPAGALAAVLLVWIALHENQPLSLPTMRESAGKMAENKLPPPSVPSLSTAESQPSAAAKPSATHSRPQSSDNEPAASNGRIAADDTKQRQRLSDLAAARTAKIPAEKELSAQKDGVRDASTDELVASNRSDLDTKNLPEELRKKEEASSQAAKVQAETVQVQNSQTQNQSANYAQQRVAGPNPSAPSQAPKAKAAAASPQVPAAAPPSQPGGSGGVASSYSDSNSLKLARAFSNPRLISPPGSSLVWRVGRAGLIEFSQNGGSSWSRQASSTSADLITGNAPSDQVCWIVGRKGAVLLTTDAGAHWKPLSPPMPDDLGGVEASDALHARVWNSLNTKSFETSDGGITWKRFVNE